MRTETLEVDGRPAEVARHDGDGPPLVLLHGAGANGRVWTEPMAHLASFDVVAPSLPGRVGSEGPAPASAAEAAAWVEALLDALGSPPAIVLGHSYGGAIAIELALRSRRVEGLVLTCTGARLRVHPSVLTAAEIAVQSDTPQSARFAFSRHAAPEVVDAYEAHAALTPPASTLADWRACDGFDRLGQLGEVGVPALVVGGEDDALTPAKYHQYLAEHLPRAQLVMIEGAGHMLPWERPKTLAGHVRAWSAAAT